MGFPRPLNIVFAQTSASKRKRTKETKEALGGEDNVRSAGRADGGIEVSFPAGPLGIDIREKNGKIVVTSSNGIAKERGVQMNDEVVQVGTIVLADQLKDVEISQRCGEVKKMVGSLPRPLNIVFAQTSTSKKKRTKETKEALGGEDNVRSAGRADGGIEVSFPAGPLGIDIR